MSEIITHWMSGLMAIDPRSLIKHPASIEQTIVSSDHNELSLIITRLEDSLKSILTLTHSYWDIPKDAKWDDPFNPPIEKIDLSKSPKAIQQLYSDFGAKDYSDFVKNIKNYQINGIYFGNNLVGIRKN